MSLRASVLVSLAALAGCAAEPSYRVEVIDSRPLPALSGYAAESAFAIAIDPDDGVRELVYSSGYGDVVLATLPRDGSSVSIASTGMLDGRVVAFVALGGGRYAYLGHDGGYVLDTASGATELRFCFAAACAEGRWPRDRRQTSLALAYDPIAQRLWTQPRTLRDYEPVRNEITAFDVASGEERGAWIIVDLTFRADAMTALPDGRLLLADWTGVHAFDPETGLLAEVATLDELELVAIGALAFDPASGHVLALEVASEPRVVELEVTRLR